VLNTGIILWIDSQF